MAEFLTTNKGLYAIEDIISQAKKNLILISPYVQIPDKISRKLKDATRKGVEITLVYGKKEELNPDVKEQLASLGNINVLFRPTLHAKCFFNEEQMVITSMNLYDYSEKNDEMGILLSLKEDGNLFNKARDEACSIIKSADKVKIKDSPLEKFVKDAKPFTEGLKSIADSFGMTTQDGHCIGCNSTIEFDTDKPLCKTCYATWAKYRNPNYPENYCHNCGKKVKTTKAIPLCSSCNNK